MEETRKRNRADWEDDPETPEKVKMFVKSVIDMELTEEELSLLQDHLVEEEEEEEEEEEDIVKKKIEEMVVQLKYTQTTSAEIMDIAQWINEKLKDIQAEYQRNQNQLKQVIELSEIFRIVLKGTIAYDAKVDAELKILQTTSKLKIKGFQKANAHFQRAEEMMKVVIEEKLPKTAHNVMQTLHMLQTRMLGASKTPNDTICNAVASSTVSTANEENADRRSGCSELIVGVSETKHPSEDGSSPPTIAPA